MTSRAVRLPADPSAPGLARTEIAALGATLPAGVRDDAVLLVSEAVTNAVQHARGTITLAAKTDGVTISVAVMDGSACMPARTEGALDAERGRGMCLVAALAESWGVRPFSDGSGKVVWFRLG